MTFTNVALSLVAVAIGADTVRLHSHPVIA